MSSLAQPQVENGEKKSKRSETPPPRKVTPVVYARSTGDKSDSQTRKEGAPDDNGKNKPEAKSKDFREMIWTICVFVSSVILMSLKPVLLHNAQEAGKAPLDKLMFLLLVEAMKIFICLVGLAWLRLHSGPEAARCWAGLSHTSGFAFPAGAYLLMNGFTVHANTILTPATFQLLACMKIMVTAVCGWALLSRPLLPLQWIALGLLTISTALGQFFSQEGDLETSFVGFWLMLFCSSLSAVASVGTEKVMKSPSSKGLSIFAIGVHMATHTILFNSVVLLINAVKVGPAVFSLADVNTAVVITIVNEAGNGLLISKIMRSFDSNVKNYMFSLSVFTTVGMSVPLFGYQPKPGFYCGAVMVIVSIYLYARATMTRPKQS